MREGGVVLKEVKGFTRTDDRYRAERPRPIFSSPTREQKKSFQA